MTAKLDVTTAQEEMHAAQATAHATQLTELQAQLEAERDRADQAGADRDELTKLQAQLEAQLEAERERADQADADRDELTKLHAQLEAERKRAEAERKRADQAGAARDELTDLETQLEAERDRADQATADRDELTRMLEAAKKSIQGMQATVDEKLAAIDAKRAGALRAAEERAETAVREREALAIELASLKAAPAATEDGDLRQRLDAATERVRVLELRLFERERATKDVDVDLGSMLPATPEPAVVRGAVPAARHAFKPPRRVRIDREGGLLVDLSVSGAQVICATPPETGRIVTLALLSDDAPCFAQGRLLWSRREQTAKGRPYRYPAGIAFTAVDEAALQEFIRHHAQAK